MKRLRQKGWIGEAVGTIRQGTHLKNWVKVPLSIFIIFHFYAVILAPNCQTYLGFRSAVLLEPYVNFFAFMTNWSFFAPEPGPPPVFIEWELLDKSGVSLEMGRWPSLQDPFFIRERQNRRITAARSMVESDNLAEKMLVPYLCEKYPLTISIQLWSLMFAVPSLSEVAGGRRVVGDEEGMTRHWIAHSFCEEFRK